MRYVQKISNWNSIYQDRNEQYEVCSESIKTETVFTETEATLNVQGVEVKHGIIF